MLIFLINFKIRTNKQAHAVSERGENLVVLYTVLRGFTHPIFQLRLPQSRWFDPAILLSIHEVLHFCVLPRDGWKIDWTCLPSTAVPLVLQLLNFFSEEFPILNGGWEKLKDPWIKIWKSAQHSENWNRKS